jgi:hypothetical protein
VGDSRARLAKAFEGSAISAALTKSLSSAWSAITGPVTTALSTAWSGIKGVVTSVFGDALKSGTSAVTGVAVSAGGSAAASAVAQSPEVIAITTSTQEIVAAIVASTATLGSFLQALVLIDASQEVQPFGFSGGGVVPSAARGMISPGGLSILHPREMVLPADISEGMQNLIKSGGGAGGDVHHHTHLGGIHISTPDAKGVRDFFSDNAHHVARALHSAMRDSNPHATALARGHR